MSVLKFGRYIQIGYGMPEAYTRAMCRDGFFFDKSEIDFLFSRARAHLIDKSLSSRCCLSRCSRSLNTWRFLSLPRASRSFALTVVDGSIVIGNTFRPIRARALGAAVDSSPPQRIATPIYPIWFEVSLPVRVHSSSPIPLQLPVSHSRFSSISVTYISPRSCSILQIARKSLRRASRSFAPHTCCRACARSPLQIRHLFRIIVTYAHVLSRAQCNMYAM